MKSVRQRGIFKIDLNKYTTDNLTLRFDENVGDMRSLMKEGEHFRQVNLDDPLYKQRELVVFVDGMNAKDFGDYINFATVQMRKKHQAEEETQDEVRIDRKNFSSEGNAFKLLYGWKNDADRRQWMNYEYQTTWSFLGEGAAAAVEACERGRDQPGASVPEAERRSAGRSGPHRAGGRAVDHGEDLLQPG